MIEFRLRRPALAKLKKADAAAHVAQVVGRKLRETRRRQGHSLDSLAALSGVSRAMLGQIETGKSVPTITVLWKVAAALDVALALLITDHDVALFTVTRRADLPRLTATTADIETRTIGPPHGEAPYTFFEVRMAAGHQEVYAPRRDGAAASLLVAVGSIDAAFGDQPPVRLTEGDAVHFSAGLKYTFANAGPVDAILYLVSGQSRK